MRTLKFIICISILSASSLFAQFSKTDVGGNLGTNYLIGDSPITDSKISPNVGLYALYNYSPKLSFKLQLGYGQLETTTVKTSMIPIELIGMYSLTDHNNFNPFLHAGVGVMNFSINNSPRYYDGIFIGGTGFTLPISQNLSFLLTADMRYTTGDGFNNITGGMKDGYFSLQSGLTYHFSHPETKFKKKPEKRETDILANLPESEVTQKESEESGDIQLQLIQLRSEIEKLKQETEEKDDQIKELKTLVKIKNNKISLYESQIEKLKSEQEQTSTYAIDRSGAQPERKDRTSTYSVKQRYQNALGNFHAKNYNAAITELTELYNENPGHRLSANFLYWIGECYFGLKKYSAAIEAFKDVSKMKWNPKLDDALLMSGLSYLKLGDQSKAKEKFQKLLNNHPKSEYAGKAKRYLNSIEKQVIS